MAEAIWPAASTSLTGPLGSKRRYAIARAPLADLVAVGHSAGVSLNDIALAAISGALRELLQDRHESPHPHAVRSLVPVSVRAPGEEGVYENRISMMLVHLPVHLDDPVERLTAVHETVGRLKAGHEAQAADAMMTLARHEPFPPISWGIRLASRLPQRQYTTVTTNVPGPQEPLYLLGRRLVEILPYVPIATRLRVGVAVFTYCGQITIGVTGDYDTTPEVERVARAIERELHALTASIAPPKPAGRRKPAGSGPKAPRAAHEKKTASAKSAAAKATGPASRPERRRRNTARGSAA
jgi:diacylglycerol O-acyltransferase